MQICSKARKTESTVSEEWWFYLQTTDEGEIGWA